MSRSESPPRTVSPDPAASPETGEVVPVVRKDLPPAARRALAEAEARRRAGGDVDRPVEIGGRDGPDPARYGDWEKKGIAIDF